MVMGVSGCAGSTRVHQLDYGDKARVAYAEALEKFFNDECLMAEPAFKNVKRLYPYTRFAALADLRVADCAYKEGKYAEAIQAYEQFVRYRPSHVEVPYARFMVARCHYEQIPGEWLLSPPAYEREQRQTFEALNLIRRFIVDYPTDPLTERAKTMEHRAIRLLAAHELYVARFYASSDHPVAAIGRLRGLIETYPTSGYEPEALLLLGEIHLDLHDREQAQRAFLEVVERFPDSQFVPEAKRHLADLSSHPG
jgi:outer membrane protein assembly factor BamD